MAGLYMVGTAGLGTMVSLYPITVFALGSICGNPLSSAISNNLGVRKGLAFCLYGAGIAALCCGMASSYSSMLLLRFLQGFFLGPCTALLSTVILAFYNEQLRSKISIVTMGLAITVPTIGAAWGGVDSYYISWRLAYFELSILAIFLASYFSLLPSSVEQYAPNNKKPFDLSGYLLFISAMATTSMALILGEWLDWYSSRTIGVLALLGLFLGMAFFYVEGRSANPLLNLRLWRRPHLAYTFLMIILLYFSYYGAVVILPQWLALNVRFTPVWIAGMLAPMIVLAQIPLIFHKYLVRLDFRLMLGVALIFLAASNFYCMFFNPDVNLGRILVSRILAGVALALYLPPLQQLALTKLIEEEPQHAMAWFNMCRSFGGILGGSLLPALWYVRRDFYHSRLGENINQFNPLSQQALSSLQAAGLDHAQSFATLGDELNRQAIALALNDIFFAVGCILLLALFALPFVKVHKSLDECPR